ncbi:tRNA dimethylallyltransferase [Kibdelosporangium banguiense]|uniref:tRNA dimethylallyltransferase n=1 Tax=Kibdelosporangium banguiense TaxID=1365924 RepID=A0ABS4U2W7_9PSEU|nr:tRNA (adenosine(37)-N6)-dimethylallyltransferase MiaA [Kibdelosporangium banguiense]MBP2331003.1 tRNA dimethylallyltransferase [Kibdelosporangium banguiense]
MTTPIAIVGPTATGKSDLGIALAERLGGEVVNADASQLYRGMDIGTAKVTMAERAATKHHLLDVLDVTENASVAAYQRHARATVEELIARGKLPILVGGSGLYVQAVLDDLEFPGTDPEIRSRLEDELAMVGASLLHERLAGLDPVAAGAILPSNGRRVVRALEVIELTGRPFSATMPRPGPARYGTVLIGLDREPSELDARIDARVRRMFGAGFVDEVRELEKLGLRDGRTASRALGYQQVLAAFDGEYDMAEAESLTAQGHRRFVRRQRSWFRRDKRIIWLDAGRDDLVHEVLRVVTT